MDGVHDMGGMHGMGPVEIEENEPVFHGEWEERMFALNNAVSALGVRNIDESRHARERMNPAKYLSSSYYEIWLDGLIRILSEKGVISEEELTGKVPPKLFTGEHRPALAPETVDHMMDTGATYVRDAGKPATFKIGDQVTARNIHPSGHTRLPRYARGAVGEVVADQGLHVFADSSAHGSEDPQHLYTVRFSSRALWGADGHDNDAIYVDLWDDHLEGAI